MKSVVMSLVARLNSKLLLLVNLLTVFLFISMTLIVFGQVVMRYLFNSSIFWGEEFARYSMIWITFLGAALGVSKGEHTRIDFFIKLLPIKLKKGMEIFNRLLSITFLLAISYYSLSMLTNTMNLKSPALEIPVGVVHSVLPFAGFVMSIYLVIEIIQILSGQKEE